MDPGRRALFASVIHEFAQRLGKENFYLIGEITGGRERAFDTLEITGLDAALGIDDVPGQDRVPASRASPTRRTTSTCSATPAGRQGLARLVPQQGRHDLRRPRPGAQGQQQGAVLPPRARPRHERGSLAALALNATTLGIPCIYYGTEQQFDGAAATSDRYIREAMFGGEFGAFEAAQRHFFDETQRVYRELAKILRLRAGRSGSARAGASFCDRSPATARFRPAAMIGGQHTDRCSPWSRTSSIRGSAAGGQHRLDESREPHG